MNGIYRYNEIIEYSDNSIVSKKIHQTKSGSITLFSFDKGQALSPHSAPYDAFVSIMEGNATIVIGGEEYKLNESDNIKMPANVEHSVFANDKMKMLLVMIKD